MKTVSVSDLKAHLSQYLREVRRGGEVRILDRGTPVARLTGLGAGDGETEVDRRHRLARAGILRLGTGDASRALRKRAVRIGPGLSDAIQEEREDRVRGTGTPPPSSPSS